MKYTQFIGVDVSKASLDISVITGETSGKHMRIPNTESGIRGWLEDFIFDKKSIFCLEATGVYGNLLLDILVSQKHHVWVVSAVHIKRSQGLVRGKSDKIDSLRIAAFAKTHIQQVKLYNPVRIIIKQLRALVSSREQLVKVRTQLQQTLKEEPFEGTELNQIKRSAMEQTLKALAGDIKSVEIRIEKLIEEDPGLKRLYTISKSVIGIGSVTAWEIIIATNEFKTIIEPKKFACYAGIAPFPYSSGSSLKGKTRVSHLANKKIKKYLHLAALSAIRNHNELRLYYLHKVAQGKHKMAVLNAVRNKIINRLFACIKQNKLYQINLLGS